MDYRIVPVFLMLPVLLLKYRLKWQYMAGVGAGVEIMDKSGAGVENKYVGSATLYYR